MAEIHYPLPSLPTRVALRLLADTMTYEVILSRLDLESRYLDLDSIYFSKLAVVMLRSRTDR